MKQLAVLIVLLAACGTSDSANNANGTGSARPFPAAVEMVPDGDRLEVTLTTEPNIGVYFSTDRGIATPTGGMSDSQGKAKTRIEGAVGPNKLTVMLTGRARRQSKHEFPFTIEKAAPIEFKDATPANPNAVRAVNCSGTVMDQRRQLTSLCSSYINLADDGTIGMTITSPSVKKLVIGEQTFLPQNGTLTARIDLTPLVADLDLLALRSEYPLSLPATLELETSTREGSLSIGAAAVETLLAKVTKGPVFPGAARTGKPVSLALIGDLVETAGELVKLRDLDLVGIVSSTTRSAAACQYVSTDGTGTKRSVARNMRDYHTTIYDRRTGKKVATKSWRAQTPGCTEWIQMNTPDSHAAPDTSLIFNWAETLVKG